MTAPTLFRLVSLQDVKDQLGILDTEDDRRLDTLIIDASQDIMDYLGEQVGGGTSPFLDGWCDSFGMPLVDEDGNPERVGATIDSGGELVLDSNGDPVNIGISIIPGPVRRATLLHIANLDDDREGHGDSLSIGVQNLLMRLRDPAVA